MEFRRWVMMASVALLLAGCGSGGGSSDSTENPTLPPPVVLDGLTILPGDATLDLNDALELTAQGHFSDGHSAPVAADWAVADGSVISLSGTNGLATVTATALDEGTCKVTATVQALSAHVLLTVRWTIPADPGAVHALGTFNSGSMTIGRYPAGGGAPELLWSEEFADGFVVDRAGTTAYAIVTLADGTQAVDRYDLGTGVLTQVCVIPDGATAHYCLDYDSQDRLYTTTGTTGAVYRIDPATNAIVPSGTVSASTVISMAVGPDDALFGCSLFDGGGNRIFRYDVVADQQTMWALIPAFTGIGGFVISGGMTMNRHGEAFIASFTEADVYRCIDVNGDGDARDVGEVVRFATVPTGTYDGNTTPNVLGLATTGGASLLVNVDVSTTAASRGVYWLTDRDDSGTCDQGGELTLWSTGNVSHGRYGNCLQARR